MHYSFFLRISDLKHETTHVVSTCVAFFHKSEKSCIITDAVVGLHGSWLSRNSPYIEFKVAFRNSFSFLRTSIELKGKEVLTKHGDVKMECSYSRATYLHIEHLTWKKSSVSKYCSDEQSKAIH